MTKDSRPSRTSVITDWRVRDDDDLPDVPPGCECEHAIAPQKFVVLHQIVLRGVHLARLGIGAIEDVPFELESVNGEIRRYRPKGLDDAALKKQLARTGAAAVSDRAIALSPGLEVWLLLRNETAAPTKARAAIVVQEEETP